MLKVYLDFNVISNLYKWESIKDPNNQETFRELFNLINKLGDNLIIPFSDIHLRDIMKSYNKGERDRVIIDLNILKSLSKNVCLTHYWNEGNAKLHYRDPVEFFDNLIENDKNNSIKGIIESFNEFGFDKILDIYKQIPHNINIKQLNNENAFLASLLPRSQIDHTFYATILDIFDLFANVGSNPMIYLQLRKIFKDSLKIDPNVSSFSNAIEQLDTYLPKTMLNKSFTELYEENNNSIGKERITGLYMQLDFVGFNSDKLNEKNTYDNLFNDALHCYYGAYCDFYITNDKRNHRKSKAVYEKEDVSTIALTPLEFVTYLKEQL